jgi:predicted XRE-type DNA-binding protein
MAQAGLTQNQLAELLNVSRPELSVMLKYELAVKEQNNIVAAIREWDALRKRGA